MIRIRSALVVMLMLATAICPAPAVAGGRDDCPRPSYSPLRYWFPGLAHCYDDHFGPKLMVCPPDRHPEITPYCIVIPCRCPAAAPGATIIHAPTPAR
jgi:hypothetical protein